MRRPRSRNEGDGESHENRKGGHQHGAESQPGDGAWPFQGRFTNPEADLEAARQIDPHTGVMSMTMYWRPKANAEGFDSGEKVHVSIFLPRKAGDLCPCGSTKRFKDCCSRKPKWDVLVPNPGLDGYDLMRPISMTYVISDRDLVVERLQADPRFRLVDHEEPHWLFLDVPPQIHKYGIVSFGDVDIKEAQCLRLETMSGTRMEYLRRTIESICGNAVSLPYYEEGELVVVRKPRRS